MVNSLPEQEKVQNSSSEIKLPAEEEKDIIRESHLHIENVISNYNKTVSDFIMLYRALEKRLQKIEKLVIENNRILSTLISSKYSIENKGHSAISEGKVAEYDKLEGIKGKLTNYIKSSEKHAAILKLLLDHKSVTREELKKAANYSDGNQISREIGIVNGFDKETKIIEKFGKKYYLTNNDEIRSHIQAEIEAISKFLR